MQQKFGQGCIFADTKKKTHKVILHCKVWNKLKVKKLLNLPVCSWLALSHRVPHVFHLFGSHVFLRTFVRLSAESSFITDGLKNKQTEVPAELCLPAHHPTSKDKNVKKINKYRKSYVGNVEKDAEHWHWAELQQTDVHFVGIFVSVQNNWAYTFMNLLINSDVLSLAAFILILFLLTEPSNSTCFYPESVDP